MTFFSTVTPPDSGAGGRDVCKTERDFRPYSRDGHQGGQRSPAAPTGAGRYLIEPLDRSADPPGIKPKAPGERLPMRASTRSVLARFSDCAKCQACEPG